MTDYWLDAIGGSDSNSGLSSGAAKKTPAGLAGLNSGQGILASDRVFWTGRTVADHDGVLSDSNYVKIAGGVAGAPTTFRGIDPAKPAEWWVAGKIVNGLGTATLAAPDGEWANVSGNVWKIKLNSAWKSGPWCFYWAGGFGPADRPVRLERVVSPAAVVATNNSFWQDGLNPCWLHVRVDALAGGSANGKILHGRSGHAPGSPAGALKLFLGVKHLLFADFGMALAGHRCWSIDPGTASNSENIEFRRTWWAYAEGGSDQGKLFRPFDRFANITWDRCHLEGGGHGLIYSNNNTTPVEYRSAAGHRMANFVISDTLFEDAGKSMYGVSNGSLEGSAIGFMGSAADGMMTGLRFRGCADGVIIWERGVAGPDRGCPRLTMRNLHAEQMHNGRGWPAQSVNATDIAVASGSKIITVTVDAALYCGAQSSITIASSPGNDTLHGVTLNGTFAISERVSDTVWKLVGNQTASGTGSTTVGRAVTVASYGRWNTQIFCRQSGDASDSSGCSATGLVFRGPIQLLPLDGGAGQPAHTSSHATGDTDRPGGPVAIAFGALNVGNLLPVKHCIVDQASYGFWPRYHNPGSFDLQRNVIRRPRKNGGPRQAFVAVEDHLEGPTHISNHNTFISEAAPPDGETPVWQRQCVSVSTLQTVTSLAAWQAVGGITAPSLDANSTHTTV